MPAKALLSDLTPDNVVDKLDGLFAAIAGTSYLGEPVTIAEHMLQSAACARRDGADDALVAAALLHDVGYYVDPAPDNENETDLRKRHDLAAARILAPVLPAGVTEPIRLHVDAKRYLCAIEPAYFDKLSDASKHTMRLQGGVMDADQAKASPLRPIARRRSACADGMTKARRRRRCGAGLSGLSRHAGNPRARPHSLRLANPAHLE